MALGQGVVPADLLGAPVSFDGPTRTSRVGRMLARRFVRHMAREMDRNAYKGDAWNDADPATLAEDLVYHALKLVRAVAAAKKGEATKVPALEFAADVANLAAMLTDNLGMVDIAEGLVPLSPALGWGGDQLKAMAADTCTAAAVLVVENPDY